MQVQDGGLDKIDRGKDRNEHHKEESIGLAGDQTGRARARQGGRGHEGEVAPGLDQ